jgi:hypothetical protein
MRSMARCLTRLVGVLSLGLGACAIAGGEAGDEMGDETIIDPRSGRADETGNGSRVANRAGGKLDVLFVIDSSMSMVEEQQAVNDAMAEFVLHLLPVDSLHVGVITPDLGIGPDAIPIFGCSVAGDDGKLHAGTGGPECPSEPFLRSEIQRLADGTLDHDANYAAQVLFQDSFACIAAVGAQGCGFEQPLAAAQRALTGQHNPGFRRPDAALAVIFVSDEDDCSATDQALFDFSRSDLGPLASFRCTAHGIVCDQPTGIEAGPGTKTGCTSNESSAYVSSVASHAAALAQMVERPEDLFVTSLVGPPDPVAFEHDPESELLYLVPSCETAAVGVSDPGVRFASFTERLGARGSTASMHSLCDIERSILTVADELIAFMFE